MWVGYASMPPTRCQVNSMPSQLDAKIYVLGLGAVQIELSIWQHRIALQLCVAHCLRSLSSLRCGVEKSLRTTNEKIFPAHINHSVGYTMDLRIASYSPQSAIISSLSRIVRPAHQNFLIRKMTFFLNK